MAKRKRKRRTFVIWRNLAVLILVLCIIWVGFVQWTIYTAQSHQVVEKSDVGIVLGAALWNGEPSPALKERLDHAIKLYQERYYPYIIVSGGKDVPDSKLSEAEGMRNYLVKQGIPAKAIIPEIKSTNTYENLLFSQSIMTQYHWKHALIITHDYHGARALDISVFLHYDRPLISTTGSHVLWMPWHKARETLAYTKWEINKLML